MKTIIFTYKALMADEDIEREQIEAMDMAAFVQIEEPERQPVPISVRSEGWQILDAPTEDAETEELNGFFTEIEFGTKALLFGAMVRRVRIVTERFHSDLYHDAMWIEREVKGETVFYWAPRAFGSNIGYDPKLVGYGHSDRDGEMHFYRVDVHQKRRNGEKSGYWLATFTRCNPADCEDLTPGKAE